MRAANYKTKQQSAIRKCIEEQKEGYVTVNDISEYLKKQGCQVGITTIYRHLEKMEEQGIVTRLNVEGQHGACFKYVNPSEEGGFYIKCEDCGAVSRMECHHLQDIYNHINSDHHFSINPKKTVFYGVCDKCSKEHNKEQ